jgi:2-dehydropantoate 2-reductase
MGQTLPKNKSLARLHRPDTRRSSETIRRVAVFGAGGIGGYLGGRLAQSGEEVAIIARGDHLAVIRDWGLKVDSVRCDFTFKPSVATDNPADVGPVDLVIQGVKAWQLTEAAEAMRPMIGPETCVLPVQNGVEAPGQLSAVLGEGAVLGGLAGIVSYIVGPGHIRHAAAEPYVIFCEMDNRRSQRLERLLEAFQRAGVQAGIASNIEAAMW